MVGECEARFKQYNVKHKKSLIGGRDSNFKGEKKFLETNQ